MSRSRLVRPATARGPVRGFTSASPGSAETRNPLARVPPLLGARRHRLLAILPVIAALIGGCGSDDSSSAGLASLAPPDAPLFVQGVIRPDGDQEEAIDSFAERVGQVDDPAADAVAAVDELFASNGVDINFADDIEPWLGEHGAAFVSSFKPRASGTPDFAAMVEVTDADAARSFLQRVLDQDPAPDQKRTYRDTQYFSSGGGFAAGVINDQALVIGTETAFKVAVDSAAGESLSESEEYTDRVDVLPDGALVTAFFEPASTIEAAIASEGLDPAQAQALEPLLGGPLSQPVAASLSATPDAASLDIAAMVDSGSSLSTESSLLTGLPGGSWFAIAVPDLGETLGRSLDQLSSSGLPGAGQLQRRLHAATGLDVGDDVFSWLGDAAAFVQGTGVPGFSAGLIAQTSDPEAPRALLEVGRRLAERESGLRSSGPPEGADYGFSIGIPGVGGGAEAGVVGDELVAVIGATASQALEPDETLGDDEDFQDAIDRLGDDYAPSLYVDLPSFFTVAEAGSDGDVDYEALRPYLEAFATVVAGSNVDGELAHSRLTVSLASG